MIFLLGEGVGYDWVLNIKKRLIISRRIPFAAIIIYDFLASKNEVFRLLGPAFFEIQSFGTSAIKAFKHQGSTRAPMCLCGERRDGVLLLKKNPRPQAEMRREDPWASWWETHQPIWNNMLVKLDQFFPRFLKQNIYLSYRHLSWEYARTTKPPTWLTIN